MANTQTPLLFPPALQPGDTLAIISPASPSPVQRLEEGVQLLERLGFRAKLMPNAAAQGHYVSGSVEGRVSDFHAAFEAPEIKGILCARGGYGAMHLLEHLNWDLVRNHPKVFIGFSDITVLLLSMLERSGLVGFHGPMLTSNLLKEDPWTQDQLFSLITASQGLGPEKTITLAPLQVPNAYQCLQAGSASGTLKGGNLTLITALCGTPWQPSFEDCLLFIEDWREAYYSIDRQWEQMKQAGIFKGVKGIILGDFVEFRDDAALMKAYSLAEHFTTLCQRTPDLAPGIPIGLGLPFGHGNQTATLPVGLTCRFESDSGRLESEYAPVVRPHPASV